MYTIEDLRNGKCAVRNDGTLEELKKVLSLAFSSDTHTLEGLYRYYYSYSKFKDYWSGDCESQGLPSQSVKDFLNTEELKCGDEVEGLISDEWRSGFIYIAKHPKSRLEKTLHIVMVDNIGNFKVVCDVRKPHPKTELTREQIAEKFGIDVDKLIIKD